MIEAQYISVTSGAHLGRHDDPFNVIWVVEDVDNKFFVVTKRSHFLGEDGEKYVERSVPRVCINDSRVKTLEQQGFFRIQEILEEQ